METDARIREAIKKRMAETGMSAAELARRLEIKHQSITPLLRGERGKVPQSLIDALDVLGLELTVQQKTV